MNLRYCLFAVLALAACSGPPSPLVVKQFQLRDQKHAEGDDAMVSMEKSRRLLGAVSMAERKERLGQYYTILWSDPAGPGDVKIVFFYQQGATASKIKKMTKTFAASETQGVAEFSVIGENYFKGGKVLTWKAILMRGNREIAHRQSYLWQ